MTLAILLLVVAMLVSLVPAGIVLGIIVYDMRKSVKSMQNFSITAHKGPLYTIDKVLNLYATSMWSNGTLLSFCYIALMYLHKCMCVCYGKFGRACTCPTHAYTEHA